MRVVHILKAAGIAGTERHLLELLPALRQNGVDARVVMLTPPDGSAQILIDAARQRDIPTDLVALPRTAAPATLAALTRLLRAQRPDIVHTHMIHADLYGTLAARLAGVRRVAHSIHSDDPRFNRWPLRLLNRGLWRLTDAGVCISEAVRRYTEQVEGAAPHKLRIISHGLADHPRHDREAMRARLAAEVAGLPMDGVWVGQFCRLVEPKGLPYTLDAFAQVMGDYPNAHLLIAGDGVLRDSLHAQAERLNLGGRAHFLGWRPDAPELMAALDLFLMPSLWEGFGITLLEAMRQAVPILGSTAGAIGEVVVHGETGLTVPPADTDALAGGLRTLLADPALRQRMGEAGLARLREHYSPQRMVTAHLALYRELTGA
jgi:glycosyltransferase involved in cell wall biosynthesis